MSDRPRRIDAHVHFWSLVRGDYDWMTPDLKEIYRDYGPEHLSPHLGCAGMDEAVLVQAAATIAETEFLLGIARETDFVSGVVGWVDLESPDATETLSRLSEDSNLKGIRPMIQDIPDNDWMLRDSVSGGLSAITDLGLSFDCLVKPVHLKNLCELLNRHPNLPAVINHCAKPEIASAAFDTWAVDMQRLAEQTSAFCKLSGLVTEAGADWQLQQLRPYVDHVLRCFGPDRLIFGSDWPVVNLAGGYEVWSSAAGDLLAGLSSGEQEKIFGENAVVAYRL